MTQYLTIIGNIGSGKSTAMPILIEALDAQPLYADDLFQTVNPFRDLYLNDLKRWAFTNELWLTVERAKMLEALKPEKPLVVVDSGLFMSWVYTYGHLVSENITLEEWRFYEELFYTFSHNFLKNARIVRLAYSVPTLLKRIKKRGRSFELTYYTPEYLEIIERGLSGFEKMSANLGASVITIQEEEIPNFEESAADRRALVRKIKESFVVES